MRGVGKPAAAPAPAATLEQRRAALETAPGAAHAGASNSAGAAHPLEAPGESAPSPPAVADPAAAREPAPGSPAPGEPTPSSPTPGEPTPRAAPSSAASDLHGPAPGGATLAPTPAARLPERKPSQPRAKPKVDLGI
jgi:NADH-quinone oxidoreductase subunit I